MEAAREDQVPLESFATGAIVRQAAPRLLRDGFGPLALFFAGWKLIGLASGIGIATLFATAVFAHERRQGRPAMIVRVALAFVAIRAGVGLSSGSARAYLAAEVVVDTLIGATVLGLLARGRPLAAVFAREIYPLPPQITESDTFARAMSTITAVWGAYFLARALVRLAALLTLTTDRYVLVAALSDAPFLIAILAWSVHHTAGAFRNSARWAPLLASAEAVPVRPSSGT